MKEINQSLNEILSWIDKYLPGSKDLFIPGLSFDSINKLTSNLDFQLPDEIYKMYEWRNGTLLSTPSFVFPIFEFMPLNEAISLQNDIKSDSMIRELFEFDDYPLFPFSANEGEHCAVIIHPKYLQSSPVVYIGKQGGGSFIAFSSITNMMCCISECFLNRAFYLGHDGIIRSSKEETSKIFYKYNVSLAHQSIEDVKSLLMENVRFDYKNQIIISRALYSINHFRPKQSIETLYKCLNKYENDETRVGKTIYSLINNSINRLNLSSDT